MTNQSWLRDIAESCEKFRELQAQGRERIGRQIGELRDSLKGLESERAALKDIVELRIQELTRSKAEIVPSIRAGAPGLPVAGGATGGDEANSRRTGSFRGTPERATLMQ